MSSETQTSEQEQPPGYTRAVRVASELEKHPHVEDVSVGTSRVPAVVYVTLNNQSISRGVEDVLTAHGATIIEASVKATAAGDPQLRITVRCEPLWKVAGAKKVRKSGNSLAVTLPREALELSGFEYEDKLEIEARDGQVRVSRRD